MPQNIVDFAALQACVHWNSDKPGAQTTDRREREFRTVQQVQSNAVARLGTRRDEIASDISG
jgi:hypothetical protein